MQVIGAARPSDFDLAAEAVQLLADPASYQRKVAAIDTALQAMAVEVGFPPLFLCDFQEENAEIVPLFVHFTKK